MKTRLPLVIAAMGLALLGAAARVAGISDDAALRLSPAGTLPVASQPALALAVSFTNPL